MVKNALLSFKKNIGKTVLLLLVIIVLVNLLICALAIRQTSNSLVEQIYANSNNEVTLMPNNDSQTASQITIDMANQLSNFQYVKNYNYNIATESNSSQINPIRIDINDDNQNNNQFIISANSSMANLNDFTNNINELIEGRLLTNDDAGTNNCVIETTLANNNNLNLNDTFTIYSSNNQSTSVELKVVGIYEIKNYRTLNQSKQSDLLNTIYTDLSIGQKLTNNDDLTLAVYYLDDLKNVDKFMNLANKQSNIDFNNFSLETNLLTYQRDITNFQKMETTATVFIIIIIIIIIIGAIILGVILLSLLKKHYNEIEIFLSLGQSKTKIILQQFLNIAMIAVVALIICLSTGRILNNTIINSLNTTTNNEQIIIVVPNIVNENDENNIYRDGKNTIITSSFQSIDDIDFNVSLDINLITILVITTGIICLLSMIISAIYVGKISPGDILIKREY